MAPGESGAVTPRASVRLIAALVVGQLGVHSAMAGLRMAAALQVLREGQGAASVGLLLALFAAAPVLLALHAGRLADRHGYHRPVHGAVAMSMAGMLLAVASTLLAGAPHFVLLCLAAACSGAGANTGMLAIQRTAGLLARDGAERVRVFSWLGIAPAFANVVGPVTAGFVIDAAGFRAAYLLLLALPLLTLASATRVPRHAPPPAPRAAGPGAWGLMRLSPLRRLLVVNWLLATCWDVHAFAVPVLGHERMFNAGTIGLVLGTFTLSVTLVRLAIPWLAHRLRDVAVLRAAMLGSACVLAAYPLAPGPWSMGALAALLGVALGSVQPMILSMLHHVTPEARHGEALALRSMAINASSTLMPLFFGVSGAWVGAAGLFWAVGAMVGAGSHITRGLAPAGPGADTHRT